MSKSGGPRKVRSASGHDSKVLAGTSRAELIEKIVAQARAIVTMRQRSVLAAQLITNARDDVDPEALNIEVFLRELEKAGRTPDAGLLLPGGVKSSGLAALHKALDRAGVSDATGLWRIIECLTTAAAQSAALWCADDQGQTGNTLDQVMEYALAFRPEALDRMRQRMAEHARQQQAAGEDVQP